MVNFEGLRIEDHETISVIPVGVTSYIEWCLEQNNIPYKRYAYLLLSRGKAPIITDVYSMDEMRKRLEKYTESSRSDSFPCAIVTSFNAEDFEQKVLDLITAPKDPDYVAHIEQRSREMDELMTKGKIQMGIYSMKRE